MLNYWKGEGKGPGKGIVGSVRGSAGQCEYPMEEGTSDWPK